MTNGDPDELWSNEKVEVRPAIIAEHSRWAEHRGEGVEEEEEEGGCAFNAPWINASHRHLPPTAFLRVKHAYPSIHPYHSFHVATIYPLPPSSPRLSFAPSSPPRGIYNHPLLFTNFIKASFRASFRRFVAGLKSGRTSFEKLVQLGIGGMILEIGEDVYFNVIIFFGGGGGRISHCLLSRLWRVYLEIGELNNGMIGRIKKNYKI